MAEAGTGWPGFSSDCLGGLQRAGFPLSGCCAISWPIAPSRFALVLSRFRPAGPASGGTVPAVFRDAGRCGQRRCARPRRRPAASRRGHVSLFPPLA